MSRPLVTVKTLLAQARERGALELPEDALVTPAAADWLRGCRLPVRRVGAQTATQEDAPTCYVIGDSADPYLQTLLPQLERRYAGLHFLPCNGNRIGLLAAIRKLCAALAESQRRRGVIVVGQGAIPACVANRRAHVRAAILSQPSELPGLMRELALNVLIIERGRMSLRQAQASIEAFFAGKAALDPVIAAALGDDGPAEAPVPAAACGCGGA